VQRKLTLLWQDTESWHYEWISEVLSPLVDREVFDGRHEVVLDNCIVVDANCQSVDAKYYAKFRGKNAFLFREPDEWYRDVTHDAYANFCGIIRMHYSSVFKPQRVIHVPVGYPRGESRRSEPKAASLRKYAWAMLGQMNKASRPETIKALVPVEPNYWYASDGWQPGTGVVLDRNPRNSPSEDYLALISEAAFCPSPMGNVSQETGRPYAALEAGSIPLLERTAFMDVHQKLLGKHPLPTFSNWKRAAGFVQTMWADKKALDQLQDECVTWWTDHKGIIAENIVTFVNRLWNDHPSNINEFVRWYAHIPGWPELELMRHHSLPALRRRVRRLSTRLIQTGRIYERS
jgi:hypothetical protein